MNPGPHDLCSPAISMIGRAQRQAFASDVRSVTGVSRCGLRNRATIETPDTKMAELINFNKARKNKARADKQVQAAENRIRFGRSKVQKAREAQLQAEAEKRMQGLQRQIADAIKNRAETDEKVS
ncbi:DUF4169 family protein [Sinimarinibacterium sp. NLF-5-8]|uniref:DUF4169 family protein n=1 Tax=Sinimarinibacterium sp. NLF-5-8 TaxID=2698684 RepID=UPI001EE4E310|nr:DUF4169 family protein [Sinimarinibacterium sp. NLF-5-8]